MSRRDPIDPNVQPDLIDPATVDLMQRAYDEAGYQRLGIPFSAAIADRGLAICLRIQAEILAKRLARAH